MIEILNQIFKLISEKGKFQIAECTLQIYDNCPYPGYLENWVLEPSDSGEYFEEIDKKENFHEYNDHLKKSQNFSKLLQKAKVHST